MGRGTLFTTRRWQAIAVGLAATAAVAVPVTASAPAAAAGRPSSTVVIRTAGSACMASVDATVSELGGTVRKNLASLGTVIATVPAADLAALATSPCVARVTPDGSLKLDSIGGYDPTTDVGSLFTTEQIITAPQVWQKGYTGQGVGVALIDTGVAPVQGLSGSGQVINGPDLSFASQSPALTYNDEYGHGTHLAGIIAGNDKYGNGLTGAKAGQMYASDKNDFIGVAPDAHIVNVKVGDENGTVDVSQVLAAIDWIVQHKSDPGMNIRVLNLSFGTDSTQSYLLDPLAFAAEVAWRNGIVVVAAAGNGGNSTNGLADPALDPFVIAVGAADTNNSKDTGHHTVASFSNSGDGTRNPDVLAPGVHIASLGDPGSVIDTQFGNTGEVSSNTRFFRGTGTSQAAAIVSGAVALLAQAYPTYTPDQIKFQLTHTGHKLDHVAASLAGFGEINVNGAFGQHPSVTQAAQTFTTSTGTGTLEGARGSLHVVSNGVTLSGEQDVFGNAFDATGMATLEASGAAWSAGTWNGAGWSGAGWSGAAWSGAAWSGAAWSGAAWSGAAWSGAGWSGAGWSGSGWSGAGWSGAGWSGAGWSGSAWSGAGWSDFSWS